ncbi:uncharacterized protein LOC18443965 isoform X2 [Amborella trichopoda]|uniref:uncharacterized protein LOC18443965 isoform X2 n=1 Tax=Amborella trichopoda TaxID=13333 RepID=UPI0009C10D4A|nr:uncharacterized protein LOC18443965 isoform X2 [Amborella trichopoda]|eukprot:XP_020529049.1 uncharacterized protein LOC18443965 isoform X2 [Amborella trichopoda]
MGQKLGSLWGRVQAEPDAFSFNRNDLYISILVVYNNINKYFPGPHKEPPSRELLDAMVERFHLGRDRAINRDEFYELVRQCVAKDLFWFVASKFILALCAAPAAACGTKRVATRVPRVGKAVEKIPTSVLASFFTVGFILLQDAPVSIE